MADLQVGVFDDADFPAATRWQALSFLRLAWPDVFSGEQRCAQHTCPPSARPVHAAVCEQQVLVSYAVVMRLAATADGRQVEVAGLGSVLTFPQYRRQGWARAVVTAASDSIAASGVELGMLFCDPGLVPLYAGSGWRVWRGGVRAGSTAVSSATMVLPVSRQAHELAAQAPQASLSVPCTW